MRRIVNLPLHVNGEDLDPLKVSGIFQQWRVPKAKIGRHSYTPVPACLAHLLYTLHLLGTRMPCTLICYS